ncbi:MAG: asparagine synthase (glutamine-hydrolyzing) [Nitrospirota bacterium]
MCGICGKINFDATPVDSALIGAMTDAMTHRGPDDRGFYLKGGTGLGMRRLSIIDVRGGKQPISNERGDIWVVLNGEIYNFAQLRDSLLMKGHDFKSRTDTEVLVHLYEEYGIDCLRYLRGMFAFAIWDEKERKLFMARDRVGKKPLVYAQGKNWISFSSEINSLLKDPDVDRTLDLESLDLYLSWQFIPHPYSIYRGIRKLPPAHYMVVKDGAVSIERYWKLDYSKKINISEREAKEEILRRLEEAVRLRMISDVPLGALLSGGLDSSAILYFMSRAASGKIKSFSIGFEEEKHNELPFAREAAMHCSSEIHELVVDPEIGSTLDFLPKVYGEPFADKSAVPSFYVSKMARKFVTVALNGDGGDENFAGYDKYKLRLLQTMMPALLSNNMAHVFNCKNPAGKLKHKILKSFQPQAQSLYYSDFFLPYMKELLYNKRMRSAVSGTRWEEISSGLSDGIENLSPLDKMLALDFNHYLPGDLLVKMDIASMANSLEVRSPFLDHELLEFSASLPSSFKVKSGVTKYILKEAMRGKIPDSLIDRRKKGFSIPVGEWLKGPLREKTERVLKNSGIIGEFFNQIYIEKLMREHFSGERNHANRLWALLVMGIWESHA